MQENDSALVSVLVVTILSLLICCVLSANESQAYHIERLCLCVCMCVWLRIQSAVILLYRFCLASAVSK